MRRIVSSVLVIGAVLALVVGAGTLALFTDTQFGTGQINAGTIDLYLSDGRGDDNGENEFIFEDVENLLPGNSVSWTMRLQNRGTSAWDQTDGTVGLNAVPVTDPGSPCVTPLTLAWDPNNDGDDHGSTLHVAPGATGEGDVIASLASTAGNDCQGTVWTVTATFNVTQH